MTAAFSVKSQKWSQPKFSGWMDKQTTYNGLQFSNKAEHTIDKYNNLDALWQVKKPIAKVYILNDSIYIALIWENYSDRDRSLVLRG